MSFRASGAAAGQNFEWTSKVATTGVYKPYEQIRIIRISRGLYPGKHLLITLDIIIVRRYYDAMIKTFADTETEKIFKRKFSKKLPQTIQRKARMKLEILDAASIFQDLAIPPGNRLEKLSGNREGQHSIRINDQWRICFVWRRGDAFEVEIVDYHKG